MQEEKKIHDTVLKEAAAACKPEINAFGVCERANGMMVVFNCRYVPALPILGCTELIDTFTGPRMQQCSHVSRSTQQRNIIR
jgi:hypothetical protein